MKPIYNYVASFNPNYTVSDYRSFEKDPFIKGQHTAEILDSLQRIQGEVKPDGSTAFAKLNSRYVTIDNCGNIIKEFNKKYNKLLKGEYVFFSSKYGADILSDSDYNEYILKTNGDIVPSKFKDLSFPFSNGRTLANHKGKVVLMDVDQNILKRSNLDWSVLCCDISNDAIVYKRQLLNTDFEIIKKFDKKFYFQSDGEHLYTEPSQLPIT